MFGFISEFFGKIFGPYSAERPQYLAYSGLSLVILGFTCILEFSEQKVFQRFLGGINPIAAISFAIVSGCFLLSFVLADNDFNIFVRGNFIGFLRISALAALLGMVMIFVDSRIRFPADINILYPQSLIFYPSMAFFVEILFHVFPLAVFMVVLRLIFRTIDLNTIFWVSILVISIIEPVYQTLNMLSSKHFPFWSVMYVGVHIFLINFFQLLIFKKYDFVSMYTFRLVYYLFWHIGWGYLRLYLLY